MRLVTVSIAAAAALLATGCTTYYMVRDPATGNAYYTTDVDRAGRAGSVKFRDDRTDSVVTIQNSEVQEITRRQYRDAVGRR